jgi:hypothetical protein
MCRNIKTLFNFDPPATDDEIRAASLQFVRKLSGFTSPSKANEAAFERAIDETAAVARRLIDTDVGRPEGRPLLLLESAGDVRPELFPQVAAHAGHDPHAAADRGLCSGGLARG